MAYVYKQCTYRVSAKALISTPFGLLLVREDSENWDLPGGGVEHFEEPEDALRREIREETGLAIKSIDTAHLKAWVTYDMAHSRPLLFLVYPVKIERKVGRNFHNGVEVAIFSADDISTLAVEPHIEKYRAIMQAVAKPR